jgi:hypothetical protein
MQELRGDSESGTCSRYWALLREGLPLSLCLDHWPRRGSTEPGSVFQDSDLKQYLDHCGNLMNMYNVKVRASKAGTPPPHTPASSFC